MKTMSIFRFFALIFVVTVFTSCNEYLLETNNNNSGENIGLPGRVNVMNENLANAKSRTGSDLLAPAIHMSTVSGSNKPVYFRYTTTPGILSRKGSDATTRGSLVTTDKFYDSYCLYTYIYQNRASWSTGSTSATTAYSDEQVYKARDWTTTEFWPGAGVKCSFFAYAPYHATGLSSFTTTGWPTFHYIVPVSATSQNDLLVTRNDISTGLGDYGNIDVLGNFNMKDYITFDHACTAIRFAIGKQMAPCTIKKIEIQNVYGEGDYQYQTESWANLSTLATYSLAKNITVKGTDSNVILNNDDDVFMMIPQDVPVGATIAVTIDDGKEHILKARIDNDNWLKGYTVTYYLSTAGVNTDYVLSISPETDTITTSKLSDALTINSYKQSYYGSQVAIPWTATYTYDENGTAGTTVYNSTNSVVTAFTAGGDGSITGEKVNFTVTEYSSSTPIYKSLVENSTHTKTLREAADGSCDLANAKQTANCYVIHAPGHYSFPLVYGNALNFDKTYNTNSYNSATFVDHKGVRITSPYIYATNNGANVPYDACIVWQDAPHLITPSSLKLSSDNHSIEFDVERDNICQGNCVIAVRDKDGNIMWNWHIWVTDYALTKTYEVHNNASVGGAVTSYFMEVPLGWCDPEVRVDGELRKFHITVKQTEALGETGTVSIPHIRNYTYGGNVTYFQWGRKDPLLPSNGMGAADKPCYDNQYVPWIRSYGTVATNVAIQHPNIFYFLLSGNWSSTPSLEYWNKGNTATTINSNKVYKTVYSPSPTGFVEPRTAAFTGFSNSRGYSTNTSLFNVKGSYNNGLYFYCWPNFTGGTVFFPAPGWRDTLGTRNNSSNGGQLTGGGGMYCTAGPVDASSRTYHLYFGNGDLDYELIEYCSYGAIVRPVLE